MTGADRARNGKTPMAEPFERFEALLRQAEKVSREVIPEPTAFALATVTDAPTPRPSVRMLLLKGVDQRGFVFYTNLESRKGRELRADPQAAMCFHWAPLELQVRVEGPVTAVSREEADGYFASRSRGSQIGAWASRQSQRLESRDSLQARVTELERKFAGAPVPRPDFWSGFRLVPERIEFWKGMPNRLHVRELYSRSGDGWTVETLYP
jgi:pyridoxamine 5'-phosphate oxidase